ncbi:peptidoglycan DD-metalloendopeptidase family protein [Aliihoeflea aestuarii]|uniref:murein hydrolase activator EnvC family protein n=1 Tax=Aliihoeflea aestuarii TaxID=453840 RepID=UPI0020931976|nr:murein hydrolase activator EnvC [Aliihoeflea aestuarii]MCO6391150.1 peptidoglycan DD-metalloendopeptidase family protein [Aliihoeflea aestuarii]
MTRSFSTFGWTIRSALALAVFLCAPQVSLASPEADDITALELRHSQSSEEYEAISSQIVVTRERAAELEAEIDAVRKDHAALSAALIQAAKTERKLQQDIESIAERLEGMRHREGRLRGSLSERRELLAEVLAALQRMGLNPPPAVLVQPEHALASVRSAILLGSVVPEMRTETVALLADLKELSALKTNIEEERSRLFRTVADQAGEKHRLAGLVEEKRKLEERSQADLATEQERVAAMAEKAGSLQDLIASLESDISSARDAEAQAVRQAQEESRQRAAERAPQVATSLPFNALRNQISLPVRGHIGSRYGEPDIAGRPLMGDMVRTHSAAIVTAPAAGTVLYAGPFRSYGQLLILNVGEGYHIVLAGMGSVSVALGQSLMTGEPIGAMGEARVASAAAFDSANNGPELYVEFRKDGKPVDPSPWWAERSSGRTGNDT